MQRYAKFANADALTKHFYPFTFIPFKVRFDNVTKLLKIDWLIIFFNDCYKFGQFEREKFFSV